MKPLKSMQERRELLQNRLKFGGVDQSTLMEGVINPMTIPRVVASLKQIEDYIILTDKAKPYTELTRSRMAIKFLDVCEKPDKFNFYDRFNKQTSANVKLSEKHVSCKVRQNNLDLESLNQQRNVFDKQVIQNAMRCKEITNDQYFTDCRQAEEVSSLAEQLMTKRMVMQQKK